MKRGYFDFLCSIVDRDRMKKKEELLSVLHSIDFYALIPNDDNRGEDGKQLRDRFVDEEGLQTLSLGQWTRLDIPTGPCTVLEMLIGLSYRLEFETEQSQWEKTTDEWFWILIDNLGLLGIYSRENLSAGDVHSIVKIFLDRRYGSDGSGGLFPLKDPQKDQRRVEIWYQMSAYVIENYPI